MSDYANVKPLSLFEVSELDSPFARTPGARFGAHQFHERMTGTLVHAVWFGGGLRIIDIADPMAPREVGYFIPEPVGGRAAPQSNDVMLDARGLIYVVDRHVGFDVLEFTAVFTRERALSPTCGCSPRRRMTIIPRPIKRRGVGAERFARLRIEINHVPAAIELELRAAGRVGRRQVVEHIARHAVGRDHVGKPVRDQQAE